MIKAFRVTNLDGNWWLAYFSNKGDAVSYCHQKGLPEGPCLTEETLHIFDAEVEDDLPQRRGVRGEE
jgi:hypothetical protein